MHRRPTGRRRPACHATRTTAPKGGSLVTNPRRTPNPRPANHLRPAGRGPTTAQNVGAPATHDRSMTAQRRGGRRKKRNARLPPCWLDKTPRGPPEGGGYICHIPAWIFCKLPVRRDRAMNLMGDASWLLSRVKHAATTAGGGIKKAPPLPPPPLRALRPPGPPASLLAGLHAEDLAPPALPSRSMELPLPGPRYPSEAGDYFSEWNRFMEAGVPNEYRTYGPGGGQGEEIMSVFRELAPELGPQDLNYLRRPYVANTRLSDRTYGVAARRMNREGDMEQRFQVYGTDPHGRRAILYSVPLEEAQALGLEEKMRALGYAPETP
jgi:hypothetical protein